MTAADDGTEAALAGWLPGRRWYRTTGGGPPRTAAVLPVPPPPDAPAGVELRIHVVTAPGPGGGTTYQVPLSVRDAPLPDLADRLVGRDAAGRYLYDGPYDPDLVRGWLQLTASGAPGFATGAPGPRPAARQVRVLAGEQSNTSVIVDGDGDDPVILKFFRVLQPGANPDVEVQGALAASGCTRVAEPVGWVAATWYTNDHPVTGHLSYACRYLADGEDAWRVACRAVDAGRGFLDEARGLGAATAEVHELLARAVAVPPGPAPDLAGDLLRRIDWAVDAVPALAAHSGAARAVAEAVRGEPLPPRQRVHGDYHLGQVLASRRRGWVLLDFEGEPLRPLAERTAPDLALRDVAGMLRSFDYAARHATVGLPPGHPRAAAAREWAAGCREAFLEGYASAAARDPRDHPGLLAALELDKALYEVVYETLNRPDWVPIPLDAVRRLVPVTG